MMRSREGIRGCPESEIPLQICWGVSPLLARRGVSGTKKKRVSDLMARDGVVAQDQKDLLKLNHHPVRSIKGASRYFA